MLELTRKLEAGNVFPAFFFGSNTRTQVKIKERRR